MDRKKSTMSIDEWNKLSPEEQSNYDGSNVRTDKNGNKSGFYMLKGVTMTDEQKKMAEPPKPTGTASRGKVERPDPNYNNYELNGAKVEEKVPDDSNDPSNIGDVNEFSKPKYTTEDLYKESDQRYTRTSKAKSASEVLRNRIKGAINSMDIDTLYEMQDAFNKHKGEINANMYLLQVNGAIDILEKKGIHRKGEGGNGGSSAPAQKPTTTPAKTDEQIKAEREALEKKADESVDKSVNDVVSAANTEDANKTSQVGAIEPDVQKLIDDINNDTDAEYDENLPRSILNAWRAGKFGDKDSKDAKATRNYYIMDAISNGITNATRYIPGAYGRNDATSDSEFNTLIKKEAENAIERKNEKIKERNNTVRSAYKDAIGNDIDTNKKIQDLKTAGIWTSYDSKMDYDKQASKLLFTELLGDDIMKYSPEEKKKLAAGLSYAADGKYDKAAAVFASDDPNFAANLLKHASEDVQNTERGNKMLDSALAIRMADIMQKYGIQNKGIDQDYLMQTIQTQFNNSKTMAEFQNNLNKDFADHQMTNDMKKAALDAALQYVKGKLPC